MVINENEVMLYGKRYKIRGPVTRVYTSTFPGKVVVGDFNRDTEQLASSWIINDMTGGLGIEKMNEQVDTDRYDFGTLETRYRHQITLLPLINDVGTVADTEHLVCGAEFANTMYLMFDEKVVTWDETNQVLSAPVRTLPHNAIDATTFRVSTGADKGEFWFYIASGDDLDYYVPGTGWSRINGAGKFSYLACHDDKLFMLGTDGKLRWTIDGSTIVEDDPPQIPFPVGYVHGMFEYFDVAGDPALYVSTRRGLLIYDASARKFRITQLQIPDYKWAGYGACAWRGDLYFGSGLDVYRFTINTVTHMGLNNDDGLPVYIKGNVIKLCPGAQNLYAVVDVTTLTAAELGADLDGLQLAGDMGEVPVLQELAGIGALFAWNERGWHTLYAPQNMNGGMKWCGTATADDEHRLWFGADGHAYYIDLPMGIHNPTRNPTYKFTTNGSLKSSRFDGGWSEIQKLGVSIRIGTKQLSANDTVKISYALNGSESYTPIATITTDGVHEFKFNEGYGMTFYDIKFKFDLVRGGDDNVTPIIEFMSLKYIKLLSTLWGFSMTVDCNEFYGGQSPQEQINALQTAAGENLLGDFYYRDEAGGYLASKVKVSRMSATEQTGYKEGGIYQLSVVEI